MATKTAEQQLASHASILMSDLPCLDAAVKNLFAVLLGRQQTGLLVIQPGPLVIPKSQRSKNLASKKTKTRVPGTTVEHWRGGTKISQTQIGPDGQGLNLRDVSTNRESQSDMSKKQGARMLQLCARKLLVGLRETIDLLPPPPQWAAQHPQSPEQNAVDRIEQLARYKVAYMLKEKVSANKGKTTKMFGAKLLLWSRVWPSARTHILNVDASASDKPTLQPLLRIFLNIFEAALHLKASEVETRAIYGDAYETRIVNETSDLVFVKDFRAALVARQRKRKDAAVMRSAKQVTSCVETLKDPPKADT